MESYSVQAVLSAVDKNFSKVFNSANKQTKDFDETNNKTFNNGTKGAIKFGAISGAAMAVVNKAMNVVRDSTGAAIRRFDTLNKYPTVMKALGYSTRDTSKSMKTLDNGIKGLPTTLDDITSAAQQFAPLTGGANSGAKAAVALNDAFLASGASVADTSRGMQQYTQMLATGKVDLMSWRTLQETMPIALRKTANAFGFTGKSAEQDLFKALQSGQITIDDLNKKFVELDKGQNGFASLARKNSVGIETSFTNMKTSVSRGLANTIKAIDDGLKKANLGGIAQVMNNMSKGIDSGFKVVNAAITKAIPPIANAIKGLIDFIKKNGNWLSPLAKGLGIFLFGVLPVIAIVGKLKRIFAPLAGLFDLFSKKSSDSGKKAKLTGSQLAGMGAKAAGVGIGIGAAAAGIGVLAFGIAALAKTGTKGLVALAAMTGSIVILAATFAILKGPLTAAIPAMLSLSVVMLSAGAAALMIGAAIALAGTGINLAAQGVLTLVKAFILLGSNIGMIIPLLTTLGVGFAAMITSFLTSVIAAVPQIVAAFLNMYVSLLNQIMTYLPIIVAQFAQILIGFITALTTYIPQIAMAITNMLVAMMNAVATNAPLLIAAFTNMVVSIINALAAALPQFITAGTNFIVSLLEGVASNIGRVISAAVDVVVAFINGIASNLGKIINAGLNLLGKFVMGIVNAIPRLATTAVQAVEKFVYGVGNALGQVLGSGQKLLSMFIKGIMDGFGKARETGKGAGNSVKDGTSGVDLTSAGTAIMGSFLGGLKSKWESVKSFVSGIAGWIKDHKGPISYDRKLLIPAGNAIMNGLNSGLIEQFKTVQKSVGSMAGSIADTASNALNSNIQALNANVSGSYSGTMTLDQLNNTQPANITIGFDKHAYSAYVADINNQQGKTALLKRNNSVQL